MIVSVEKRNGKIPAWVKKRMSRVNSENKQIAQVSMREYADWIKYLKKRNYVIGIKK